MVTRRVVAIGSSLCLIARARAEHLWLLVTPEEVRQDRARPHGPEPEFLGSASIGPDIQMVRPDIFTPVRVPVSLLIQFVTQPGTSIDSSTFKATYGWLNIDITKRLLDHATLSASGLSADNASIPPGVHRVTLSVADSLGHVGSRVFSFTVIA
jgi:hypothetical protein